MLSFILLEINLHHHKNDYRNFYLLGQMLSVEEHYKNTHRLHEGKQRSIYYIAEGKRNYAL